MMKKVLSTATVAVSLVGVSAMAAPQALAVGNDTGTSTLNGNGATQTLGESTTKGHMSPQLTAVQGSLNKLCLGIPLKANIGSLIGLVPITVQDINVLSAPQNQQCADNSTQSKGDEPLSHILEDIPVAAGNGVANH